MNPHLSCHSCATYNQRELLMLFDTTERSHAASYLWPGQPTGLASNYAKTLTIPLSPPTGEIVHQLNWKAQGSKQDAEMQRKHRMTISQLTFGQMEENTQNILRTGKPNRQVLFPSQGAPSQYFYRSIMPEQNSPIRWPSNQQDCHPPLGTMTGLRVCTQQ